MKIHREKITWPGAKIKKKDEGMPNYHDNLQKGVLTVTFDVDFPKGEFSTDDKEALKKLLKQESKQKTYNGLQV